MDHNHQNVLTKDGLAQLKAEYNHLVNVKRPEVVKRLSDARDLGDLSENSEYAAAKQDLAFIDGRIVELEEFMRGAKVVSGAHGRLTVDVGSKVVLHINGKREEFTVVGEWEADPTQRKISHDSPLGKALIGKKPGDTVQVDAPAGKLIYKILEIG